MALLLRQVKNFARSCVGNLKRSYASQAINGQTLYYEEIGKGPKSIMLLPGALGSSRTDFSPILSKFDEEKYTVIAWDPPGYGKSRPPNRTWPGRFFNRDAVMALDLMKALNRPRFSCVGWSDGGNTAMVMAIQDPEAVERMVLWGSNSFFSKADIELYELIKNPEGWSPRMRKSFEEDLGADYFRQLVKDWYKAVANYPDEGDICRRRLSEVRCPTLVLHGTSDPIVPSFHPDILAQEIPNASRVDFPGGKHNFHLKYADEFMRTVNTFLA